MSFTQIPNKIILDNSLSLEARFLYSYFLAYPNNWLFHPETIQQEVGMAKNRRLKFTKELTDKGLIKVNFVRNDKGQILGFTIFFSEFDTAADSKRSGCKTQRLQNEAAAFNESTSIDNSFSEKEEEAAASFYNRCNLQPLHFTTAAKRSSCKTGLYNNTNIYIDNNIDNSINSNILDSNTIRIEENSKKTKTWKNPQTGEKENIEEAATEILDYLNEVRSKYIGSEARGYKPLKSNLKHIIALLNSKESSYTKEDFKKVIDFKCADFAKTESMKQYIRPETLFCGKFESYLANASIYNPKEENKPMVFKTAAERKTEIQEQQMQFIAAKEQNETVESLYTMFVESGTLPADMPNSIKETYFFKQKHPNIL